jgi:hypothetical protein
MPRHGLLLSPAIAGEGKNTKLFLAALDKWMTPEQLYISFAESEFNSDDNNI